MESYEKNQTEYAEITSESIDDLVELRLRIDNNKTEEKLHSEAEKFATREGYKAIVSRQEGQLSGYVEVMLKEDSLYEGAPALPNLDELAHLARIGVVSKFRGQGIGQGLLTRAEEWAKGQGRKGIWLGYLVSNETAARLYKRAGYKDIVEFMDLQKGKMRRIAAKQFE